MPSQRPPAAGAVGGPAVQPLLRWAGSKRALLGELISRRPPGEWRYIEPFAGSACFFFALQPGEAILGDRNAQLIETYRVIREHPEEVARRVHAWPVDRETYYSVRAKSPGGLSTIERSARFVYLNRLCFNGVYRTNRAGQFNVPFGRDQGAMPSVDSFTQCARLLSRAELRADDFEAVIASTQPGDFVYLDPPYSRAGSEAYGVYGYGSFDGADLERLIVALRCLDEVGARVLLSYTWDERLLALGEGWWVDRLSVRTHVSGNADARSARCEALIANYGVP